MRIAPVPSPKGSKPRDLGLKYLKLCLSMVESSFTSQHVELQKCQKKNPSRGVRWVQKMQAGGGRGLPPPFPRPLSERDKIRRHLRTPRERPGETCYCYFNAARGCPLSGGKRRGHKLNIAGGAERQRLIVSAAGNGVSGSWGGEVGGEKFGIWRGEVWNMEGRNSEFRREKIGV